jgi:hypothetical protein
VSGPDDSEVAINGFHDCVYFHKPKDSDMVAGMPPLNLSGLNPHDDFPAESYEGIHAK